MAKNKKTTGEKNFEIEVMRISYSSETISVKAKNRKEAERLALEKAPTIEFREHDAEYKVDE